MIWFKKKKKSEQVPESKTQVESSNLITLRTTENLPDFYMEGKGDLWDVLCPDGLDLTPPNHAYLTDSLSSPRPMRSMYITKAGWPRQLSTDWISKFMGIGEVDLTIYVHKIPPRQARTVLNREMTILRSNLDMQMKLGQIDQIHDLQTKISDTDALLGDIQLRRNDYFHTSVQCCVYGENEEMLDRITEFLEDELGGSGIHLRSAFERQDLAYLSVLPRGKNELLDIYRNLDRRSLSTIFPFASSEMRFTGGVPFAINQSTGNLVFLNLFDESSNNYNGCLFGESGSGKTFAVETLVGRNLLIGCRFVIIDPEGEFKKFTKRLGALYIKLGPDSPIILNPCAITVTEIEVDEDDEELRSVHDGFEYITRDGTEYVRFVPVREKIEEIVTFFNILSSGFENQSLNTAEERYLLECTQECFQDAGITNDPKSLYRMEPIERDGIIIHDQVLKDEITITDIYNKLIEKYRDEPKAQRLIDAIHPFLRGNTRGFFDGQTYFGEGVSTDLLSHKIVTFDLSDFELGSPLRKLAYHICQVWTWHKFVKNPSLAEVPKGVISEEYWQVVDQDETVTFSEVMARRCRKRHCSYIISTQDAKRVLENKKAYGVVTNCTYRFILRQNSVTYNLMKQAFDLSDGEMSIVMGRPKKGEMILRTQNESVWIQTDPFEYEKVLFESNSKKKKELERQMRELQERMKVQQYSPETEALKARILETEGEYELVDLEEPYEVDEVLLNKLKGVYEDYETALKPEHASKEEVD